MHGVSVCCSVLYNMHHEGYSPGPSRAWGVAFMAFITPCTHAQQGVKQSFCPSVVVVVVVVNTKMARSA